MADETIPPYKGARNDLTVEYLRSILDYDPETGILRWRADRRHKRAGQVAGTISETGHLRIWIKGHIYMVHRLIWLMVTESWPKSFIDHKDMNGGNNRWDNLREATMEENQRNRTAPSHNTSGYKGVSLHKKTGLYQARITSKISGGQMYLGVFNTPEKAHEAYLKAALEIHGDFMRGK